MKNLSETRDYAAFISYRHKSPDKEIAKALQLLLEYNLVRPDKRFPRHIRPVFLDTSELPTLEDLDEGIIQALDRSDCLFVICSPQLKESKYCMREISYFKEKHGGSLNRVATLLVEGEPQDAYPKILRTETVKDPQSSSGQTEVEVEPLFADVRGKNLLHSLWRLCTSEYLRLAARYYGCSYDALKKRHKRMAVRVGACALIAATIIGGILFHQDQQIKTNRADAIATYATEQLELGNERLALALCSHAEQKETDAYMTALRSAVVQQDYKQRGIPAVADISATYYTQPSTHFFLSKTGHHILTTDLNMWHIIDTQTGLVQRQFPFECAYAIGSSPERYIALTSHPDQNGVFWDYVVMMDLETDSPVWEIPFRESVSYTPSYQLIIDTDTYTLGLVQDYGETVAFFTLDGISLLEEEYAEFANQIRENPDAYLQEHRITDPYTPYSLVRDRRNDRFLVKNSGGTVVLELKGSYDNTAVSADWKRFAWVADGEISVYDLETGQLLGTSPLNSPGVESLYLLAESSYYIAGAWDGQDTLCEVRDWKTGELLLTFRGSPLVSPSERAFFTVREGTVNRYVYSDLDIGAAMTMTDRAGDLSLFGKPGQYILWDNTGERILLESDARQICLSESGTVLLREAERLLLCDREGIQLLELPVRAECAAISPDGTRCAWLDTEGILRVANTADGTQLYQLSGAEQEQVGTVRSLAVSGQGLCLVGSERTLWLPQEGQPVDLGSFDSVRIFSDGVLILESNSRVNDFLVYDTARNFRYFPFQDNTGNWAYAPKTGYLVRHVEASGNSAAMYLEVWKRDKEEFSLHNQIGLPENRLSLLELDSTGELLSCTSGGCSRVFRLSNGQQLLRTVGTVFWEGNVLYADTLYGDFCYSFPMGDGQQLLAKARELLTGPLGIRTLTEQEKIQFAIAE